MFRRSLRLLPFLVALCVTLLVRVDAAGARVSTREYLEQQLLVSTDFRSRVQAALGLGRLSDPRSRVPLERALSSDSSAAVREAAAASLGMLRDRRAIPVLRRASDDESASVRRQAAAAMAAIRQPPPTGAAASRAVAPNDAAPAPTATPAINWRRVRHVVALGEVSDGSPAGESRLLTPLRTAVLSGLRTVEGVAPFASTDELGADVLREITRRRLPRFRIDAVLTTAERTEQNGQVRLRFGVNLLLYQDATHNVLGMLSGSASATESAVQAGVRDDRMTNATLQAAVRSALSSAATALERAARR
jgi:hypothetical protein